MTTYNGAYAHVGANTGIRAKWSPLIKPTSAWWISQSFPNQLWAQVGYYPPGWFYQVWNLAGTNQLIKSFKASSQKPQDVMGNEHTFEISLQGGHGAWAFLVNGKKVGGYGIGQDSGSGDFLATNEFSTGQEDGMFSDMQYLINGVWTPAPSGHSFLSGLPQLGVSGYLQNGVLPPGTITIKGAATEPSGTLLWSGA